MWLDLAALVILAGALWIGAVRGWWVSSVRLLGAVCAYLGAFQLGPPLAPRLEAWLGVSGMLAVLAGGLVAFFVLLVAIEIVAAGVKALDRRRLAGAARSTPDRLGGAAVSALAGLAFAVLVGWLAISVDALRHQTKDASLPSTEGSRFAPVARRVIRGVGEWALAGRGPAGVAVARAASEPVETLERVERLLANPHLAGLREDALFWQQVENGRYAQAVQRASFLALAYDGTTRRELAELGLIDAEAAASSQAFRERSLEALAAIGPRLRAVRQDPALERLAADPEVSERVLANDTLALLRHPDVRQLIARALAPPSA